MDRNSPLNTLCFQPLGHWYYTGGQRGDENRIWNTVDTLFIGAPSLGVYSKPVTLSLISAFCRERQSLTKTKEQKEGFWICISLFLILVPCRTSPLAPRICFHNSLKTQLRKIGEKGTEFCTFGFSEVLLFSVTLIFLDSHEVSQQPLCAVWPLIRY